MNYFLLHLTLNGIKNISNEIQLDFYNKFITTFSPELYRVKAIYGENGTGKTAIMTAVNIAKKLLLSPDYLKQNETQSFLGELVCKKTNRFSIQFEFVEYDDNHLDTFKYSIAVSKNENGVFEINAEKFDAIRNYTRNKKYQTVFEVVDGRIVSFDSEEKDLANVKEATLNLLKDKPLLVAILGTMKLNDVFLQNMVPLLFFFISVNVYLDEEDMHEMYLINKMLENMNKNKDEHYAKQVYSILNRQISYMDAKGRDIVDKGYYAEYEKKVSNLQSFIKLFKKDLVSIGIDKRDNGDTFKCELILHYDGYDVNREFESTGIKKLIRIYDALANANSGGISFIDEMDSNINDVYLCKLVEYFMYYSKGQICFTTHNVDPMTVLKNNKNSIDFLSTDNKVVSWKVTGNAAPDRYYRNGMIENSPFNIDAIDFIGIFGE